MNPQQYQAFTDALQRNLERDPRVLGLMAAGSMADASHPPDQWSDHDFWVVAEPEAIAWFRTHSDWLPDNDALVMYFKETMHDGLKAIYRSGHLLEFAVSDRAGLASARVNDYRLLIDRAGLAEDLARMQRETTVEATIFAGDDVSLVGQYLTNLLVGVWRYRRGEIMSGRQLITVSSLHALLRLIPKHFPAETPVPLDNLDPLRRIELAYPTLGAQFNAILRLEPDRAALALLDFSDDLFRERVEGYPAEAVATVRRCILPSASSTAHNNESNEV